MRGVVSSACVLLITAFAGCLAQDTTGDSDPLPEGPDPPVLPSASWTSLTAAALPRAEHCAANVGPTFYIVGGYIIPQPQSAPGAAGSVPAAVPTATVEIYDAASDSWSMGPDYPNGLDHCMAVGYDGWIYVFHSGGYYKINPDQNEWVPFAAAPHGHNSGVAALIEDKIYLVGGGGEESVLVDVYDPAADAWSTIESPMLTRRGHTSGAAVGGKLYVIGGDVQGHSVNTDANQEFDPATEQWRNRSVLPVMRGSLQSYAWAGHVVVMGGQNGATNVPAFKDVHAYDPVTDTWKALPDMEQPRHGFAGAVWDDRIFVFAGAPQQGVSGFADTSALAPSG